MVLGTSLEVRGGGDGNPLQYPCLDHPRDRGDWGATVCGVRESDPTERLSTSTHWSSVVKTSPSNAGLRVRSLVGELGSHMPHGQNTKT